MITAITIQNEVTYEQLRWAEKFISQKCLRRFSENTPRAREKQLLAIRRHKS